MIKASGSDSLMILIPAHNEEGAIANVIREVRCVIPGVPILVVDDCSTDGTRNHALLAEADVLSLPYHLGLGGGVQAGYRLAFELGFSYVIRIDGDGQHDPRDIPVIFEKLKSSGCQMVIGSRFMNGEGQHTSFWRKLGILFFRAVLRPILDKEVRDPTSGFVGVNKEAIAVFAKSFPLEYPEIEALVVLQRRRFRFEEIPTQMRKRQTGRSSITAAKSLYYIIHVLLGVFVNILKYGERRTTVRND